MDFPIADGNTDELYEAKNSTNMTLHFNLYANKIILFRKHVHCNICPRQTKMVERWRAMPLVTSMTLPQEGEEGVDRNGEEGVDCNGEEGVDRNGEEGVDCNGEEGVEGDGEEGVEFLPK